MSRITIAISHFEQPDLISRALLSLTATCLNDLQIIVMDDFSSEDSFNELLQTLVQFSYSSRLRVRLFKAAKNVGCYRMKNALLNELDTEFLSFHDADDYSVPLRFDRLYSEIRSSNIDILGSSYFEVFNEGSANSHFHIKDFFKYPYIAHKFGKKYISYQPSQLIRFQCFETLGGFDGTTRIGADDEFTLRAIHCKKVRNLNEPLYVKVEQASSLTMSVETGYSSQLRQVYKENLAHLRKSITRNNSLDTYCNKRNDIDFEFTEINI
jgi:glycosyltransferase involved in cell wall biosynthesis